LPADATLADKENELLRFRIRELEHQIQESRRLKSSLEDRLRFEELLSEISSVYANLSASEVDRTIEYGLQRIGEFLGAERCNLAQYEGERKTVRIVHSWGKEGIGPLPEFLPDASKHFPWVVDQLIRGKVVQFSDPGEMPEEAAIDRKNYLKFDTNSHLSVPIAVGGAFVGSLSIGTHEHRTWPEELAQRLRLLGEIFANAIARKEKNQEIRKLNDRLEADCSYLREEIDLEHNPHDMIGQSVRFKQVIHKIQQIAATDATVLVLGKTGTGKELVARAIHQASRRKARPMVKVNCAALPANLIESELFGHEKGAFTSALARQTGRFELADGNTLFLDEIGELPLESQAKLLRVLQDGEFERLGSSKTTRVDVRIIAATNRNLEEEVRKGRFRQDLWYRLNVFPIMVPPLRERREDIPLLVEWFVSKFGRKLGKAIKHVPPGVMGALQNYPWPGNIRELENVIERAAINTRGPALQLLDNLDPDSVSEAAQPPIPTFEEAERSHIIRALEETRWRITGPKGAARLLDLNPSTLRGKMRKLGIQIQKVTTVD